jgi:nucleoside-diphosphate-sugar epimerase
MGVSRSAKIDGVESCNSAIDLTDWKVLRELLQYKFHTIIHLAAVLPSDGVSEDAAYQANKAIDLNILRLAERCNARVVYASGTSVYGFGTFNLASEQFPVAEQLPPYIRSKVEGERLFSELGNNIIILRISAPYHQLQRSATVLKIFISLALSDKNLFFHGSGNRMQDFTHATDIAELIVDCHDFKTNGIFNISYGKPISMLNLAQLIVKSVPNCKSQILPSGLADSQEDFRASYNLGKARGILGWSPKISLEEGIQQWVKMSRA